ncbi:MAG: thymidylate kinase [archaeon]|nr:thymidylate kinase [archaeon]
MKLIVFDGLDGCGKDTQAKIVYEHYAKQGKNVVLRSHPSKDNFFGRQSKAALERTGKVNKALATVFFGADAIRSVIKYSHKKDIDILIFSRYVLAVMYLPSSIKEPVYKFVCKVLPVSKYMFFLDISPEVSLKRIRSRNEKEEMFENKEAMIECRQKAESVLYNWNVINADGTPDEIAAEISSILED